MGEDLVSSVLGTLTLALPPELLKSLQQGPRGTEEEGVLLGDGVVQGRVIAVTAQPAAENRPPLPGLVTEDASPARTGNSRVSGPVRGGQAHSRCITRSAQPRPAWTIPLGTLWAQAWLVPQPRKMKLMGRLEPAIQ